MPSNLENGGVLSFEDARHAVEQQASRVCARGTELLKLLNAVGRILAEPVLADRNLPPFPRATRDGYAVHAADLVQLPAALRIIGEAKAGAEIAINLNTGEAVSIMTGAPVPSGADAVVMVEHTSRVGDRVEITKGIASGENIVPEGSEAKRNDCLLPPGTSLDHAAIALAASVGKSELLVYSKPRVAVLATGDELVDVEMQPAPYQIRNSNSYSLAAQIQAAGGEPILLPVAADDRERLRDLIVRGLESDLLLLSGGVSMGRYDLVEQVLTELHAEFFFTGAKIQPGRPVVFGQIASGAPAGERPKHFFGLPGNPVSTMVTFELFVRPLLGALAGMAPRPMLFLHAKLKSRITARPGLKRFLPAVLSGEFEKAEAELVRWQGSGDIAAVGRANCFIVIAPDQQRIEPGEWVPILLR